MLKLLFAVAAFTVTSNYSNAMDLTGQRMSDNFEDRGNTSYVEQQVAPFLGNRLMDIDPSSPLFYDIEYSRLSVNLHARRDREKIIRLTANVDAYGSLNQISPVLTNLNILPPSDILSGELLNDSLSYQSENEKADLANYLCEEIFGSSYSAAVTNVLMGRRNLLGPGQTLDTLQCRHRSQISRSGD